MPRTTFRRIFSGPGASTLAWEVGTRCDCYDPVTHQPAWDHEPCGGLGTRYSAPTEIRALFRGQSRWTSHQSSGEHGLGEAQLTTSSVDIPTVTAGCKPGYTDERVRDRFTVLRAAGDVPPGRVWYPAAQAIPFMLDDSQAAWRVQLQGMDQATRVRRQP